MVAPLHSSGPVADSVQVRAVFWQEVLRHGIAAPSPDNCQPWTFRLRDDGVDLALDRSRVPADDLELRQSLLSCGAVLFNLRVALLSTGRRAMTSRGDGDVVARVRVVGRALPTTDANRLFGAIPHRRTWLGPYRTEQVADPIRRALVQAAAAEGARLQFVDDPHQRRCAEDLVVDADRQSGRNTARPGGTRDGARLAVLTTVRPDSGLVTGQALQRVLLTAAAYGLSSTMHAGAVESSAHRRALGALLGRPGSPMAVMHLGYGGVAEPTPRRGVADFLLLG